jgi:diguanylate cyclase (GGDEF)-like protein
MLMDATVAPPSKQSERPARLSPGVSTWWALIGAFSTLLLLLASTGDPDEALRLSGAAAAVALTAAFGVKLHRDSGSNEIHGAAIIVALAATAAFEIGAVWLQVKDSPWPPPAWMTLALLTASFAWLAASASRFSVRHLAMPLIEALLPGTMLAFAALYSVPSPAANSFGHDRFLWMLTAAALAMCFGASSLAPASIGTILATLGVAGVLLGSLGGTSIIVVLGNTAFAFAGLSFFTLKPDADDPRGTQSPGLNRIDLLLAPALVLLVFVAILLRGSGDVQRQPALRLCAAAALVLLLARQIALLWSQRIELVGLDRAQRELSERASLDALTRLPNRDALRARLHEEIERARRYEQPVSLCYVDVDYFKTVNDRFGHAAGDVALRTIAATLRRTARSIDFVGRYGGEEFLVVAPGTQINEASILGERLRAAVAEKPSLVLGNGEPLQLTISVGLAEFPANATSLDQLIDRADTALYVSKRGGRNRVTASRLPPDA